LLVSNLLPFTSPAFAYLIAMSQPEGQEWTATLYLLVCSMPAGALIPIGDKLMYLAGNRRKGKSEDPEDHFRFTNLMSFITDHMPFSFWVRPFVMEPAFAAAQAAKASTKGAASTAVLAGHFMVWSGPATSMYQRKFVPDWITCILIQPLGLFEDVAVVLATWAGQSAKSQQEAEIGLYGFMIAMNCVRYLSTRRNSSEDKDFWFEHLIVMVLTILAMVFRVMDPVPEIITTTTTTMSPPLCATEHSNTGALIHTVLKVSALALAFRVVALVVKAAYMGIAKRPSNNPELQLPLKSSGL